MSNRKFYEAVLRDALPISREYADKGWPPMLYPWFLALMQLPDADKPAHKAFTLHMGDSIRAGALPAVRQRIPWFIENEVIEPHVNAKDFAAWLAREGMEPSPLVSEWFAHQGVASPAPAQAAAAPALARLLPMLPLPKKMSAVVAADVLGGGLLRLEYVMHLVADGGMASWSHSPAKGDMRRYIDRYGPETELPRITLDTDPASVFVAGDDVLWHWCVLQEEAIHAPAGPPKEAVERRLESIYALQRVPAPAQPQAAAPMVADSASNPPLVAGSASNEPLPLTTGDIAFCFDGIRWNEKEWRKPLGDKPKWLQSCVAIPGQRGVSETRWNPVLIAAALVNDGHTQARSIRARFQTKPQLRGWLEAWKTYEADNFDTQ